MTVELDRTDIVSLLKGNKPNYSVMNKIPKELGSYVGGMVDDWKWNNFIEDTEYADDYLYDLYLMCKNSWQKNNY